MITQCADVQSLEEQSRLAGSRWDNSELMQLRVRVIALENVVISLLTQSSDRQLDRVRDVAAYIEPRPGVTPHPLTIRAAAEMLHLLERARHFREMDGNTSAVDPALSQDI